VEHRLKYPKEKILLYYQGALTLEMIAKLREDIRERLGKSIFEKNKLFSVFIELADNISKYSVERNTFGGSNSHPGNGSIIIVDNDNQYKLHAGNIIDKFQEEILRERYALIKGTSKDELRVLKRELRSAQRREGHKGGNIGLVEIAIRSNGSLQMEFIKIDDEHHYLISTVQLDKISE